MKAITVCLLICVFVAVPFIVQSADVQVQDRGGAVMVYEIANSESLTDDDLEAGIQVLNRRLAHAGIRNTSITLLKPDEARPDGEMSADTYGLKVEVTHQRGLSGVLSRRPTTRAEMREAMAEDVKSLQVLLGNRGSFEMLIAADAQRNANLIEAAFGDPKVSEVSMEIDGETKVAGRWVPLGRDANGNFRSPPRTAILRLSETGEQLDTGDSGALFEAVAQEHADKDIEILLETADEESGVRLDQMLSMEEMIHVEGRPAILFKLNREGAIRLSRLTGANVRRHLCVVIDGELLISPRINEPIGADGVIEGNFTQEEVDGLVAALNFPSPLDLGEEPASIEYVLDGDR